MGYILMVSNNLTSKYFQGELKLIYKKNISNIISIYPDKPPNKNLTAFGIVLGSPWADILII